jgi:hypothetical protein
MNNTIVSARIIVAVVPQSRSLMNRNWVIDQLREGNTMLEANAVSRLKALDTCGERHALGGMYE